MSTLLHVGIRASNLERSIRFWRDGLGLKVAKQRGDRYDLTDGYHNFARIPTPRRGTPSTFWRDARLPAHRCRCA